MRIEDQVSKLQSSYKSAVDKDKLYAELLDKYRESQKRIQQLEEELKENSKKLPTKEDVDSMSSMLDLINKLDPGTIEKLSQFGKEK